MFNLEEISLTNVNMINEVKSFLTHFNLTYESDIDYTIVASDNNEIIATASKSKNVLKCFAIKDDYQGEGIMSTLVKKIEDRMFKEGLYHFFIYTPSKNKEKFKSLGYSEIIDSVGITILESGKYLIDPYLKGIKKTYKLTANPKAAIIMNGNPFTKGHRYLIESCAIENEEVLVFVVSENKSSFPFDVRFSLIAEGCSDLTNVHVIETGPYLVSNATFPTYFLKDKSKSVDIQTRLDCEIFSRYYSSCFNIKRRYIGNEPYCPVTNHYNEIMKEILPKYGIEVKQIERKEIEGKVISASIVRSLLINGEYETIKKYVPEVTYNFLISQKALPIINKIKESDRH